MTEVADRIRLPDARQPLSSDVARATFAAIIDGRADAADLMRFLADMANRGETVDEVVAAATALRARAICIEAPVNAIDVCGTGGDGRHTLNVSTAVAIVAAACGVPVAKHGNRAASSRSGAADALAALGLDLDAPVERVERALRELGIGFLFAARHHAGMANVAAARRALGRRTIFNLVGPLANPAGVRRQLVGVFARQWLVPLAQALAALGAERAMIVHGDDGVDELTVTGPSHIVELRRGRVTERMITPADAGLGSHPAAALAGGTPAENAARLRALLGGAQDAYRDIVLLNAAAALIVAGRTDDWREGATLAAAAIDRGDAAALLDKWIAYR